MPVVSTHVFVNHKGGVGKSTLCYHLATAYAQNHPDEKVLVLDFTEVGDVSEFFLGGAHNQRGKRRQRAIAPVVSATSYLLKALAQAIPKFQLTDDVQEDEKVLAALLGALPQPKKTGEGDPPPGPFSQEVAFSQEITESQEDSEEGGSSAHPEVGRMVSIERYAIPLCKANPRLPENLFLCPSGGDAVKSIRFSETQRRDICEVLNKSYEQMEGSWKLFIDTDSDKSSYAYAEIALGVADYAVVPLHADVTDFYRVRALMMHMCDLMKANACKARVQQILWNQLTGRFNRELDPEEGLAKGPFIPLKAEQDMIATLDALFYKLGQDYPELFVLPPGPDLDQKKFATLTSVCVRNFGTVNVASKDTGVPIPVIQPGIFHGSYQQYVLGVNTVHNQKVSIDEVVKGLSMTPRGDERQLAEDAAHTKPRHEDERIEEEPTGVQTRSASAEGGSKRQAGGPPEANEDAAHKRTRPDEPTEDEPIGVQTRSAAAEGGSRRQPEGPPETNLSPAHEDEPTEDEPIGVQTRSAAAEGGSKRQAEEPPEINEDAAHKRGREEESTGEEQTGVQTRSAAADGGSKRQAEGPPEVDEDAAHKRGREEESTGEDQTGVQTKNAAAEGGPKRQAEGPPGESDEGQNKEQAVAIRSEGVVAVV